MVNRYLEAGWLLLMVTRVRPTADDPSRVSYVLGWPKEVGEPVHPERPNPYATTTDFDFGEGNEETG